MLASVKRLFFVLVLGLAGCVVDTEIPDGLREIRPEIGRMSLVREPDGAGRLDFAFKYVLAITDERGIAEVRWSYRLVTVEEKVLAQVEQRMRESEPDQTRILVEGERARTLEIPAGGLESGGTYVLWVTVVYPGEEGPEIVGELLQRVRAE